MIQRFGPAASLNIHLHCLLLDGVYGCTDGEPVFVEELASTERGLLAPPHKIIARLMKLPTRRGVLVEEERASCLTDGAVDSDDARALRPLRAAACIYRTPAHRTEGVHGRRNDAARNRVHPNAVCRRSGV